MFGGAASAHECEDDALQCGNALLKLHFGDDESFAKLPVYVDETSVEVLKPIRALAGKGKFDVLEVWGYVYKGEYRRHFIYAQIPGECVLMGQEIIEFSDPYYGQNGKPARARADQIR
jgi:hypothetical protein